MRPTVLWVTHHIPEAITLSDRVVLLTPRPGRVAGILEVELPRPRDPTTVQFQDLVRRARAILARARQRAVA